MVYKVDKVFEIDVMIYFHTSKYFKSISYIMISRSVTTSLSHHPICQSHFSSKKNWQKYFIYNYNKSL